ncbi:hypothetical protein GCK32_018795 [Trichostrongylus colubriformis]|uniref:Uncharacterized protein n=1 Tax=Trichostrongylus colubriformis TaxID=6319 RepID=A0AAN8EWF8_TRICO
MVSALPDPIFAMAVVDLLLDKDQVLPISEQEQWQCLEEVDFSFNDLKKIDESVRLLGSVQKLNISHNSVTEIGGYLQHLTCLTELDLSSNGISSVQQWNQLLGNVKKLILSNNAIKDVSGEFINTLDGKLTDLN